MKIIKWLKRLLEADRRDFPKGGLSAGEIRSEPTMPRPSKLPQGQRCREPYRTPITPPEHLPFNGLRIYWTDESLNDLFKEIIGAVKKAK